MDDGIGQIVANLKSLELSDNTIIIFASDNGAASGKGGSNSPLKGGKHAIWEGGTRTIGFIYIPPKLYNNTNDNNIKSINYTFLMHAIDWYPTLMEATGITTNINKNLDGVSHWNNFINIFNNDYNISKVRNDIYYGNDNAGNSPDFGPYNNTGYRKGHFKLLNISGGTPDTYFDYDSNGQLVIGCNTINIDGNETASTYNYSLYNLQKDPNEYDNVASKQPDQVAELAQDMAAIQATSVGPLQKNESCPKANFPNNTIVGTYAWPWC